MVSIQYVITSLLLRYIKETLLDEELLMTSFFVCVGMGMVVAVWWQ